MLGPFDYGKLVTDGQAKERRVLIILENGAKYEGEW
jgi:hypothetical protein